MEPKIRLELDAISEVCRQHHVSRLRVFGSVLREDFDPQHSDVDFLVDFDTDVVHRLRNYFSLKDALSELTGTSVDLVVSSAVENPYFAAEAFSTARDVFAA